VPLAAGLAAASRRPVRAGLHAPPRSQTFAALKSWKGNVRPVFVVIRLMARAAAPNKAVRIEVDKPRKILRAFGKDGELIAVYPVTLGSTEKPAPSGTLKVTSVAHNPTY
jgi:L,D-transpeptidase catalytic domain